MMSAKKFLAGCILINKGTPKTLLFIYDWITSTVHQVYFLSIIKQTSTIRAKIVPLGRVQNGSTLQAGEWICGLAYPALQTEVFLIEEKIKQQYFHGIVHGKSLL